MNKIIAICGMTGSGKTKVIEEFEKRNFKKIYFGGIVVEETKKRGLELTEENERIVRLDLRRDYGMGAMAILSLTEIKDHFSKNDHVIIDGLYSWEEYKICKKEFMDNFINIVIHASPKIRYERLKNRPIRPRDPETSRRRDYAELEELGKGNAIAMGDYNILNEGTEEELINSVNNIIDKIFKNER